MEIRGFFEDGMAHVSLRVENEEFRALVDTGYDGFIMLPLKKIAQLKLRELFKSTYLTADGKVHEGRMYRGHVDWFGAAREIPVDSTEGDFTLIGMKLLHPLKLEMEPAKQLLALSGPDSA